MWFVIETDKLGNEISRYEIPNEANIDKLHGDNVICNFAAVKIKHVGKKIKNDYKWKCNK